MDIKELVQYLERRGCNLSGCSERQVSRIEKFYNVKLPASYVAFLLAMGRNAGYFMRGSSVFFDEIFDLRNWSIEMLAENGFKELPEDTFVFFMHQGYQFAFFYLNNNENPPVYYYLEGSIKSDFELVADSFTGYLELLLSEHE